MRDTFGVTVGQGSRELAEDAFGVAIVHLAGHADAVVEGAASGELEREVDVGLSVDHLVQADDMRVLKFLHSFDLALYPLLHAKFSHFLLVVDLNRDWRIDCFVDRQLDFSIRALAEGTANPVVANVAVGGGHDLSWLSSGFSI